jgi:hypothetical protein
MPLVRAGLYTPDDWRKSPKVLFERPPTSILGRGAALDDARGRGGPTQRRLPQGALDAACTLRDAYFERRDAQPERGEMKSPPGTDAPAASLTSETSAPLFVTIR